MLSSVPLGFFSPAVIFSSFVFVGTAAVTTTQPRFFCLSVQKPSWIRHQMGPSCYNQQYLFSFIINYNWVEWNVGSDLSPLRIPQNPDLKLFFFLINLSTGVLGQPLSVTWVQLGGKKKKITVKCIFSIPFSSKNTNPWESSSVQLETVNSMVFAYGAPWVHLVLSFQAGVQRLVCFSLAGLALQS